MEELNKLKDYLNQQNIDREILIQYLDPVTDMLRGGFDTTDHIDYFFEMWNILIQLSFWHIKQYALSSTKYIFENTKLNMDQKKEILKKHSIFVKNVVSLLGDKKREVRDMSSQCICHLTIHVGAVILEDAFGVKEALFSDKNNFEFIEGQMNALGRLAVGLRVVAPDLIESVLNRLVDNKYLDTVSNPVENGYVYWYSTRSLYLLCTNKTDITLSKYKKQFDESHKMIVEKYGKRILDEAKSRICHKYINCRSAAAQILALFFGNLTSGLEEFIDSLMPKDTDKWIERAGSLLSMALSIDTMKKPFNKDYTEKLASRLYDLVNDPISCDSTHPNQKSSANSMAARALTKLLKLHDESLFQKYVHNAVLKLLKSPIASLLDGGLICCEILASYNKFDITDLYILMFKNICHTSFPIREISNRILNVERIMKEHSKKVYDHLLEFSKSEDVESREIVLRALQKCSEYSSVPDEVIQRTLDMIREEKDSVQGAALDLFRHCLNDDVIQLVPAISRMILSQGGETTEEPIVAVFKLIKSSIEKFHDTIYDSTYELSPLVLYHALSPLTTPVVSSLAHQVLVLLAKQTDELDEELEDILNSFNFEEQEVDELLEMLSDYNMDDRAHYTSLMFGINQLIKDYDGETQDEKVDGIINSLTLSKKLTPDDIDTKMKDKSALIKQLVTAYTHHKSFSIDQFKCYMQKLIDACNDENVTEKLAILLILGKLRTRKDFHIPDPTPVSLSHDNEQSNNANK